RVGWVARHRYRNADQGAIGAAYDRYRVHNRFVQVVTGGSGTRSSEGGGGGAPSSRRSSSPSITSTSSRRRVIVSSLSRRSVRIARAVLCASVRILVISASIFLAVSSPYCPRSAGNGISRNRPRFWPS